MTDDDRLRAHANRGNATYPPRAAQFSWEDCAAIANALVANVGQGEVWRDHNGDIVGEPIALARIAAAALADAGWTPPATVTITLDNGAGRFVPAALPQPRRSFWHRVLQALARR